MPFEHNYTPTGDLRMPALTLSTPRDPFIPGFHRTVYGQLVAANGSADLLVQRSVPGFFGGYGHCTFTPKSSARPSSTSCSGASSVSSQRSDLAIPVIFMARAGRLDACRDMSYIVCHTLLDI